jgi:hypothetical protein
MAGFGYHKVNAFDVPLADPVAPFFSLSHNETRAWVMGSRGDLSASLDGILIRYTDADLNPDLDGRSQELEVVGSVGYQVAKSLKVSGDLTFQETALVRKQVMGLIRAEYRFGIPGTGGR